MAMMFKIIHEEIAIPTTYLPPPKTRASARQHHDQQFQKVQASVDSFKFAFVPRTSSEWNELPPDLLVAAKNLACFKTKLRGYLRN